jgi:hypothetical protein
MAIYISNSLRSLLFIIFLIPSVFCSIFVLYHFLVDRRLRNDHRHHLIILTVFFNLVYELTDIVWIIYFYETGTPLISTPSFCLTWVFIDFAVYLIITYLIVWMAIERHILIFHSNWLATQRKRFLLHYFPMILACIYPLIFYTYGFFIQDCSSVLDYTTTRCGYVDCLYINPVVGMWDSVVDYIAPTFLIVIFSVALALRIFIYRRRARRQLHWRQYKKLFLQLIPVSIIYLVMYMPTIVLYTAYTCGLPTNVLADFFSLMTYVYYFGTFFIPFAGAVSLPELKNKCKKIFWFWHRPQVVPAPRTITLNRLQLSRSAAVAPAPAN